MLDTFTDNIHPMVWANGMLEIREYDLYFKWIIDNEFFLEVVRLPCPNR